MEKRFLTDSDIVQEIGEDGGSDEKVLSQKETQTQLSKKVDANFGVENTGKLLYVDESGNVSVLQLGDWLEIVNGRLCITGTVTPDEPDEPDTPVEPDDPAEAITFTQTGENSVAVSGVVFEQQEDGTVLWRGATFTPGEENSVVIK